MRNSLHSEAASFHLPLNPICSISVILPWRIVPFSSIDLVAVRHGIDLDLAKLAIPREVRRVITQAVLMMEFLGYLVQRLRDLVHTVDLKHSAAGGLRQFL